MTTEIKDDLLSTANAEKWLTPDIFLYQNKLYRVNPDFTVVELNGDKSTEK